VRHYPKKKKKKKSQKKGWWSGSSSKSALLTSVRPRVQTPVPKKKKKLLGLLCGLKIGGFQINKEI
jgi:hypothetical protein